MERKKSKVRWRSPRDRFSPPRVFLPRSPIFSKICLVTLLFAYFILAAITSGLSIPFGTFVPNLFMGACLGRLFGLVASDSFNVPASPSRRVRARRSGGACWAGTHG